MYLEKLKPTYKNILDKIVLIAMDFNTFNTYVFLYKLYTITLNNIFANILPKTFFAFFLDERDYHYYYLLLLLLLLL